MTTSSRNQAVRMMIQQDGEEETKAFVRNHYNIPSDVTSWKEIDAIAEARQKKENMEK